MFVETANMNEKTEEIYARNIARVYRICYLRLHSAADAEDAAQNVFLRWLRKPAVFRNEEHEKAYFIVCAQNEAKNAAKNYWRTHRTSMEEIPEPSVPDSTAENMALAEQLFTLPPPYRETLYLYYYEGYSTREIARLTGRRESTVRSHLARGRERLKVNLEGIYETDP